MTAALRRKKKTTMPNAKEELDILIADLVKLGEDPVSLSHWTHLFAILEPAEQVALLENLQKERTELLELAEKASD